MVSSGATEAKSRIQIPGWDALLLFILVMARLRIDSLAETLALPFLRQDVLRHPILGNILPAEGIAAMGERGPWPGEPLALWLIATTIGLTLLYLVVDLLPLARWRTWVKWILLAAILSTTILLPTVKLMLLREQSGPASYSHDGGVIQTESTIDYFLSGLNPYIEDYTDTAMAEWGFDEYRTALYHYPYLPWTFVFSTPFYWIGESLGFYDQRIVYLILFVFMLIVAPRLVTDQRAKLGLVMLLALNPIMGLDILFGQNDSFVLAWIVFSLVAWQAWQVRRQRGEHGRGWLLLSVILFGLACASKPTAWFFAPFYGVLLLWDDVELQRAGWLGIWRRIPLVLQRVWPGILVFALLIGPYLLWDAYAFYEDVWRWSSGQGETGYQIWGWGASNFVLGLGLVESRFEQWPFWMLQILLTLPIFIWFLYRQQKQNTLGLACWHYGLMLAVFFFGSRFLNENYLGYILAFLAIGYLAVTQPDITKPEDRPLDEMPVENMSIEDGAP
jgi:hypothetical protein